MCRFWSEDPDLLTVEAVKVIQSADVIMCPTSKKGKDSIAYCIVSSIIDDSKNPRL